MTWQDAFMDLLRGWLNSLPMLGVLIILMTLDIVTGLIKAWVTKTVSSSASRAGMMRKVMMLAIVAAGQCMQVVIPAQSLPWAELVSTFFCVTELISIMENAAAAGISLPTQLVDALKKQHPERAGDDPEVFATLQVKVQNDPLKPTPSDKGSS